LKIIFRIIYFTLCIRILLCPQVYGYAFVFLFLSFSPSILLGKYSNITGMPLDKQSLSIFQVEYSEKKKEIKIQKHNYKFGDEVKFLYVALCHSA
jgi:hypothetical protein